MERIVEERRDGVLLLRLNRPEKLNAIDEQMLRELCAALEEARLDDAVRVVVLTGNERAFSAGADIDGFANVTVEELATSRSDLPQWDIIRRFPKPLIAAVAGIVFGGGLELTLACDIVVAAQTARFAAPEIRIGLIPGAGGTQLLTRRFGKYRAMELVLTGREFSADEAERLGLVNVVTPPEEYLDRALELARQIAQHSPAAVRAAKAAIVHGLEMPLDAALRFERELFLRVFTTPEAQGAIQAFLERRRAKQQGG
ncbi:enoyl-CoA hydratase/isomerase family protein [Thermomicrobium sp. 4228-Ro]|uniref:enoyl-CoA hydratase/isomerase family protein n=1 Tax=Thermomicrobium sp. 4228-Ro TaxID=2993937 RepID=UPI0022491CB8|nr:enoyl-CoA hydratase/isomerase family protein [Thermomicrobium sp. 4228-Ro]MCX2728122.1 enoyl-CoA hydratase/isomerase family protein [Thermomicrobium sp. 4228-Ro]